MCVKAEKPNKSLKHRIFGAGQFLSRSFVVLLRKSIPQKTNLQSAAELNVRKKMNNLPMADATPKGFDSDKIMKIIFSRNLGGLANNTKWNELITAVRANDEWRPSYRIKSVAGYISGWDCEWFYHLPFPFLCVEWFDISLESPSHINSNWVLNLVSKIGFEYEVKNEIIKVWGYGPKSYEEFN